ncbi:MAG: hypothetical protein JWM55_1014 [Acidimicrobiaceae bacterium]|nr:hypothetical protein [Acidimicrobiaceae bacterium]
MDYPVGIRLLVSSPTHTLLCRHSPHSRKMRRIRSNHRSELISALKSTDGIFILETAS